MNKYTRTNTRKQRKKIKPRTKDEQRLYNAIMKLYNKTITEANKKKKLETEEDLLEALQNIDLNKIKPVIKKYGQSLLKRNREGFINIMGAMFQGKQQLDYNKKANSLIEEKFAKALPSLIQEKKIYEPYMEKFFHNMGLIKNVSEGVIKDLHQAYLQGEGLRGTKLEQDLQEKLGSRARLIIRTESSKLNSALTEVRAKSFGIQAYIWSTSDDIRVRPSHKIMNNVLVFFNDPPTLDKMTGHAGEFP